MAVLIFILIKEWGREKERIFFFSTEVLNMALCIYEPKYNESK